jgi:dolichol-phosphate mannosyltransferase
MNPVLFVIPAYNEAANLPRLLMRIDDAMRLRRRPYRVLVVDDGSTDGTAEALSGAAQRFPVERIAHSRNRGPGAGFRTGLRAALARIPPGQDADTPVVTMEADNTSDPSILNAMLDAFDRGVDLTLASCYAPGGAVRNTSALRVVLSAVANGMLRALFRLRSIHTYSSFYRIHSARLLRAADRRYGARLIEEAGFVCMVELLLKLQPLRPRMVEIPMLLDGRQRQDRSKMRIVRTTLTYLRLMARLRLPFLR